MLLPSMKRLLTLALLLSCLRWFTHAAQPSLLLIIADDCTYRDLGVYGGQAGEAAL